MKVVAFTGAGISKPSGIPTFEDLGEDFRTKLSRSFFREHPDELYEMLRQMRTTCLAAEPNPAHLALAKYDIPIITMNIDGLHQRAGSKTVIELHGQLETVYCPICKKVYNFDEVETFSCCGYPLQPNVVLYEDMIPKYPEAFKLVDDCDVLLIIGTSFYTSTSSEIKHRAEKRWPRGSCRVYTINENAQEAIPKLLDRWLGGKDASIQ